jgi:heptosyltransferase-2
MDLLRPYDLERRPSALIPLRYDKADNEAVNLLLKEIPAGKFLVGIEAGAAESALCRMWDRRKFAELCDKLVDDGCAIAFVGAGHEAGLNAAIIAMMRNKKNVINTAGRVRLTAFFCFAKRLDMMISNDTGSMHIAAAQGTPTIGLFCPNTPVRFAPYGKRNASIYKPVLPEPCINVHKAEIGNNCSTHNHMSRIEVVDVYGAYRTLRRMRT